MEVTLSFKTKAQYSKFMRNFRNGKGTVISNKNVDLGAEGEGIGEFFNDVGRKIKRAGKDIKKYGKQAVKIALPGIGAVAGDMVGGPFGGVAGMTAGTMAANQMGGSIIGDIKKTIKQGVRGVKGIARRKEVKKAMNSIRPALRELKKIGKEAMHQKIAETVMNMASNLGENDPLKAQALSVVANEAHGKVAGLGFKPSKAIRAIPERYKNLPMRTGLIVNPDDYKNIPTFDMSKFQTRGGGYSDSLGGNGVLQSIQNINSGPTKGKKTVGGSFKLP